jgi:hypothetical protein
MNRLHPASAVNELADAAAPQQNQPQRPRSPTPQKASWKDAAARAPIGSSGAYLHGLSPHAALTVYPIFLRD